MSLLLLFRPLAGEGPPTPEPEVTQTPAGRKRKRRYVVEIDGREFYFDSAQEALDLLTKAKSLAKLEAEKQAEKIVSDTIPKALSLGKVKPVQIKTPVIAGSFEIVKELERTQREIRQLYQDASIAAELRILMALDAERDDEEVILLSL